MCGVRIGSVFRFLKKCVIFHEYSSLHLYPDYASIGSRGIVVFCTNAIFGIFSLLILVIFSAHTISSDSACFLLCFFHMWGDGSVRVSDFL